ncbi:MAG TPA: PilZ domain-containing protein [Tepidisphaeraceae bacterium]|jgi:hypothetical protein|nr:PilZ domain-containing protein [Tepidisphaeraceae bacterium]
MDLSAEQFAQIVTSLGIEPQEGVGSDERRRPRAEFDARASLIPLSDQTNPGAVSVKVRDLSPSGIGFLHDRQMVLDEQFALLLPRDGDTPAVVLCTVAFWQPLARDLFAIGARFTRILRDGGIPALPIEIYEPATEALAEKRALQRKAS